MSHESHQSLKMLDNRWQDMESEMTDFTNDLHSVFWECKRSYLLPPQLKVLFNTRRNSICGRQKKNDPLKTSRIPSTSINMSPYSGKRDFTDVVQDLQIDYSELSRWAKCSHKVRSRGRDREGDVRMMMMMMIEVQVKGMLPWAKDSGLPREARQGKEWILS